MKSEDVIGRLREYVNNHCVANPKINTPAEKQEFSALKKMGRLKGIPVILSPDLLHTLAKMGHGDEIVLADANFPAA